MKKHSHSLLCLCLAFVMALLTACNVYGERKVADKDYMAARREALSLRRPDESSDYAVFTAVVDMDMGDHVETLICRADGTVHLYLSTGEAYKDLHKINPALSDAARDLLTGLGERLDATLWQSKTDVALPESGRDLIYLCSDKGIHTLTLIPAHISEASEAAREIYNLYRALYQAVQNGLSTQEGGTYA